MSDDDKSQEKTEQPTPKRLEKSREDGQAPRSKELTTTAILLASSLGLLWFGQVIIDKLANIMRFNYTLSREVIFDPSMMIYYLSASFGDALLGLLPLFSVK